MWPSGVLLMGLEVLIRSFRAGQINERRQQGGGGRLAVLAFRRCDLGAGCFLLLYAWPANDH